MPSNHISMTVGALILCATLWFLLVMIDVPFCQYLIKKQLNFMKTFRPPSLAGKNLLQWMQSSYADAHQPHLNCESLIYCKEEMAEVNQMLLLSHCNWYSAHLLIMRTSTEIVDVNFMYSHWYYLIEIRQMLEMVVVVYGRWSIKRLGMMKPMQWMFITIF